uniref:Zinc finger CCCH domain-containing protein 38 n=1 Tax=Noccaea caerulescens TaxID=107243 RepID=A0A1J3DQG2_NOCCA
MSGWGTKNDTKWDSKEDTRHHHHSSVNARPASYYRDKEPPETAWFNAGSNGSRRSAAADDQHSGETRSRSRVAQSNDDNYYSEPDETRQPFLHRPLPGSSPIIPLLQLKHA